jgi:16S rRNA (guanine527-N7)-methyltransferase
MNISDVSIHRHLEPFGFNPSSKQTEQIRAYADLLLVWNKKISLTTVIEPAAVLRTHFGESIFAKTRGLVGAGRLADVGTGAGFPGFALAIASPELQVALIEPNLKKTVFLSEVKRELRLENVEVVRATMDTFGDYDFDYIISRALGRFSEFLEFAVKHSSPQGKVLLWLSEPDAVEVIQKWPEWRWDDPLAIPLSDRRCILPGEKPGG